jgi:hypothetical protein
VPATTGPKSSTRSLGQVTRRDLIHWGIFTSSRLLVCKNGLSPWGAAQPAVRRSEVLSAAQQAQPAAPRGTHEVSARDGDRRDVHRCLCPLTGCPPVLLPHGFLKPAARHDASQLYQSHHRARPDGKTPARRGLCPSAPGRIHSRGRICFHAGPGRGQSMLLSRRLPQPESTTTTLIVNSTSPSLQEFENSYPPNDCMAINGVARA